MGLLLLCLLRVAGAACPDVPTLVDTAERAAVEGRLDAVAVALDALQAGWGCGPIAEPALLARMWLADGTRAAKMGDERLAGIAFGSAARVSPGTWVEAYGPELRRLYDASRVERPGEGQVRVSPVPEGFVTALDGRPAAFPARTSEGLHLVQVGPALDRMAFASVFFLPADDTFFALTGLEQPVPVATARAPAPTTAAPKPAPPVEASTAPIRTTAPNRRNPAWLASGGAVAAIAVGTALLAVRQDGAMEDAATLEELDRAYGRQKAWAYASYGCMGLAAVGVGLWFAI